MLGLLKAVVETVKLPFDVTADVITMGGAMTDKDVPYTVSRCRRIMKKLNED
jgi:hypothetical protein